MQFLIDAAKRCEIIELIGGTKRLKKPTQLPRNDAQKKSDSNRH